MKKDDDSDDIVVVGDVGDVGNLAVGKCPSSLSAFRLLFIFSNSLNI